MNHELLTERLQMNWVTEADAEFMLAVWNDPTFIRYVGDRGIRTAAEAREAVRDKVLTHYEQHGYGPCAVSLRSGGPPMGICGLFKREHLDHPDIGYGFLPPYRGKGYALEAAQAVVAHARDQLRIPKLYAIVSPDNERSVHLLEKLGMRYEGPVRMPDEGEDISLYSADL
jgi:RimJ/RimL family protein N-acetyltransferase